MPDPADLERARRAVATIGIDSTALDGKVATIKPIRSDPDFGDEYSPEDDAVLRRFDELVPPDLEGAGTMTGPELHQAVVDLARKAGLV